MGCTVKVVADMELGFGLREIKATLDSPSFDRREALLAHRRLLTEKRKRLDTLILCVDRTIDAMERGTSMDQQAMFEGFDEAKIKAWQEEARARRGSENVDESIRRTSAYSGADWAAIGAESNEINQALAARMDRDPTGAEVQAAVERWFPWRGRAVGLRHPVREREPLKGRATARLGLLTPRNRRPATAVYGLSTVGCPNGPGALMARKRVDGQ